MSQYDNNTIAALHEALDDEYRARATYAAVIERFGPVTPFVNIVVSEDRHAAALERLLRKTGAPVPADRWAGVAKAPDTLRDAYALGVQAEIDNHAMYERLRGMTAEPEVLRVFDNLASASQDNHLTAFRRHLDGSESTELPMIGGGRRRGGRQGNELASSPATGGGAPGGRGGLGGGGGRGWRGGTGMSGRD